MNETGKRFVMCGEYGNRWGARGYRILLPMQDRMSSAASEAVEGGESRDNTREASRDARMMGHDVWFVMAE